VDQLCATFLNEIPHDHEDGNGCDPPTHFFFRRLQGMVSVSFWGSAPLTVWRDKDATAEWKRSSRCWLQRSGPSRRASIAPSS
jgi:hypothetical protein